MLRSVRRCIGLLIMLLIGSIVFWPSPSNAARAVVVLADGNQAWGAGRFFRTGLARDKPEGPGGVQLVPASVVPQYQPTNLLPRALSSHTSVVYRNRIFVLGGDTLDSTGQLVKSNQVFTTRRLAGHSGALEEWQNLPSNLPVALADMAAVVVTVDDKPFIVTLGGIRGRVEGDPGDVPLQTHTTARIFYYPIVMDSNGVLNTSQSWQTLPESQWLPHNSPWNDDNCDPRCGNGARGVAAAAVNVNGVPYIYIFGGHQRSYNGATVTDLLFNNIWRARVQLQGNQLSLGPWESRLSGMSTDWQIQNGPAGAPVELAGAATVTYADPETGDTGVYLVGGVVSESPTEFDANVYVAKINGRTGAISWLPSGNMSAPRAAHAAIESDGVITVSGGREKDTQGGFLATTSLSLGLLEPDLSLYRSDPNLANFELTMGALNRPRALHSMVVIDGGRFPDYAYIIGGEAGDQSSFAPATRDVLMGNLDVEPSTSDRLVGSGRYTSSLYDFGLDAKYYRIEWQALLPKDNQGNVLPFSENPIKLAYRVGNDPLQMGPFIDIDVTTVNGSGNSFTFPLQNGNPPQGRYFQFAAILSAADGSLRSPILDRVQLDVERNGFPNVSVKSAAISIDPTKFVGRYAPSVRVANYPYVKSVGGQPVTVPGLPANWDGEGYLYIDMYITYQGPAGQSYPRPPKPALGMAGDVYAVINKASLPVNAEYSIPFSTSATFYGWRPASCAKSPCPAVDWNALFSQQGQYHIWVMIDSVDPATYSNASTSVRQFGNVIEAEVEATDGETDNWAELTITVEHTLPRVLLPLVTRAGTATGGASVQQVVPLAREQLDK